jgi:hypothetical protein
MNQTIERTYVTLSQAKLLKDKFDVPCRMCVADDDERPLPFNSLGRDLHVNSKHPYYSAPEQWELVEWLRVNHGIWINVDVEGRNMDRYKFVCFRSHSERVSEYSKHIKDDTYNGRYDKPQDALSAAFDYVLNKLI